jgi:RND family efflux transporter MFP subunit
MSLSIFKTAGLAVILTIVSCSGDKQSELKALKDKHDKITEQISKLEREIVSSDTNIVAETNSKKIAVKEMKPEVFDHFIEIQGKLDGEENIGVSAKAPGTVDAVYVRMGDKVEKGKVLAKLDDAILQQTLKTLNDNLAYATELYEKQSKLWEQKIGSEVQYLSAKNSKENIENNIKVTQNQINMMQVISPITGTIEEVAIKIGQSVGPGFPIFRVVNFSSMKVIADVAEAYSSRVNVGDEVLVHFPDLDIEVKAKISSASKFIGTQNRTFEIEVRMKPELNNFKANMIAILKINDYRAENSMMLPVNLIQNDKHGSYVFVAEKSNPAYVAKKLLVKTGQSYNGIIEITEGLKPGDLVVTAGQLDLQDGEKVRI